MQDVKSTKQQYKKVSYQDNRFLPRYFQLRDITVSDLANAPIRNFLLNFNDDEVTGIATVETTPNLGKAGTPCRA